MITIPTPPSGTFGSYKVAPSKKSIWPYVTVVAAIAVLAVGYYFFFYKNINLFLEAPNITPAPPLTSLEIKLINIKELPFGVMDSDFYKSLKIYGALPVVADSLGRSNPFIPY